MRPLREAAETEEAVALQAPASGLYDPSYEHDACGVAFVARMGAPGSHEVMSRALYALEQLEHRGAEGADPDTGDGSGILTQLPDAFLRKEAGVELPDAGGYGVAMCFLPREAGPRERAVAVIEAAVKGEGQRVLGWRDVPVNEQRVRHGSARLLAPRAQLFVGAGEGVSDRDASSASST